VVGAEGRGDTVPVGVVVLIVLLGAGFASFPWRWMRLLARTDAKIAECWRDALEASRYRCEAAHSFLEALREVGYAPQSHARIAAALNAVEAAESVGPTALAEADAEFRGALLAAYRALPPDRIRDVQRAHDQLVEAEDELDLARHRYNELAVFQAQRLGRVRYRVVAPWAKVGMPGLYVWESSREEILRRYGTR